MQRDLNSLQHRVFDLAIVGGGISGACLAHDAAQRGLDVALVERADFGGATSAASSKLLHGGIRYLQHARLDKVRESAYERACFQRIAPHLTRWVPFAIPTHAGLLRGRTALRAAVAVYDLLTHSADRLVSDPAKRTPSGEFYEPDELTARVPAIAGRDDLTGAQIVYESHLHSSERMTLAFLKTAVRNGAAVANYVTAQRVLRTRHRITALTVCDEETGDTFDIQTRVVANVTGPWIGSLDTRFEIGALRRPVTGFSKGAHIVTRQIVDRLALALSTGRQTQAMVHRGGRHIFVIPWRGHSLIGTTDHPYDGDLDQVAATDRDVDDLLADVNDALPGAALTRRDVTYAFAGLYPLTARQLRPGVYQGSGDFQIVDHGTRGDRGGVVSVLGAKFTTARRLAELTTTRLTARLGRPAGPCRTHDTPLVGGQIPDLTAFTDAAVAHYASRLDRATVEHLVHHYGTELDAVMQSVDGPDAAERLTPARESVVAEVVYAVEHEMARRLDDVVFRRTGLGTIGHPGQACLRRCAELMGRGLRWTAAVIDEEVRRTDAKLTGATGRR